MTIALGTYCKDMVTGIEGYAMIRIHHLTGCDCYSLQPVIEGDIQGKSIPDSYDFDETRLVVDTTKPVLDIAQPVEALKIPFGTYVRDKVTGFEGYAIIYCVYVDGHISVGVQAKRYVKDDDITLKSQYFTQCRLEIDHQVTPLVLVPIKSTEDDSVPAKKRGRLASSASKKGADKLMGRAPMDG